MMVGASEEGGGTVEWISDEKFLEKQSKTVRPRVCDHEKAS